jgi:two-component system sensor histidine kinase PilS (NtrC family)
MDEERKDLAARIRWLLLLRVIILSFFFGTAAVLQIWNVESDAHFFYAQLVPLITAYAISVGSMLLLGRIQNLKRFAHVQVDFDVLLITGTIWITGDVVSPFSFLYNLAVINGAILLFYRGAFQTAAFASFCYLGLSLAVSQSQAVGQPQIYGRMVMPLVWNLGSFFAIAALSGFLARKLGEAENLLRVQQQEYRKLEALKDALLEGVGSGVAVTDTQGRINYYNAQAQQLTMLSATAVEGKPFGEVFPATRYRFDAARSNLSTDEFQFVSTQGDTKQLRLTVAPLSDLNRAVIGYAAIFEDITKQRQLEENARLEEELRRAREVALEITAPGAEDGTFHFEF